MTREQAIELLQERVKVCESLLIAIEYMREADQDKEQ